MEKQNLLFICGRNEARSPTASVLWQDHPDYNTRSAGTSLKASKTVSPGDLRWADIVFVMEHRHRARLQSEFPRLLRYTPVYVLEIPGHYDYMDPALMQLLRNRVGHYLPDLLPMAG